jgi:hypothetical protein
MPVRRPIPTGLCLIISLTLTACAGSSPIGASPAAPTLAPSAATALAPLMVQVDKVCAGRESDIRVFVDAVPIGVTNPGDPGVSRLVTVGDHQLSAISRSGTEWGPFQTTVSADGLVERLGCLPADAI